VNKREETLKFPDNEKVTVELVLKTLSNKYGKPFIEYVYNSETRQPKTFAISLTRNKHLNTQRVRNRA
jgi:hypothetical protein